jgi:hypothetical protein
MTPERIAPSESYEFKISGYQSRQPVLVGARKCPHGGRTMYKQAEER